MVGTAAVVFIKFNSSTSALFLYIYYIISNQLILIYSNRLCYYYKLQRRVQEKKKIICISVVYMFISNEVFIMIYKLAETTVKASGRPVIDHMSFVRMFRLFRLILIAVAQRTVLIYLTELYARRFELMINEKRGRNALIHAEMTDGKTKTFIIPAEYVRTTARRRRKTT